MQVRTAWCIEIAKLSAMARPNVLLYPTVPLSQYVPVYLV
jgi:hypothetical protein